MKQRRLVLPAVRTFAAACAAGLALIVLPVGSASAVSLKVATPTITAKPDATSHSSAASFSFSSVTSGANFECKLDSGSFSACTSPQDYTGLADGSHTFTVHGKKTLQLQSDDATWTWTVATTATPVVISAPSSLTNVSSPSFAWTNSSAGATFSCRLDSGSWAACTSPSVLGPLSDGPHSFEVKANTVANGDSEVASTSFTVDATAPAKPTVSNPGTINLANRYSPPQYINVTNPGEAGLTYTCSYGGATPSACQEWHLASQVPPDTTTGWRAAPTGSGAQWQYKLPVIPADTDGTHTYTVTATDAAGNTSSTTVTWVRDTVAPAFATVTSVTGNNVLQDAVGWLTDSNSVTVDFKVGDGDTLQCFAHQSLSPVEPLPAEFASPPTCSSSKTVDLSGYSDGTAILYYRTVDAAGNSSDASFGSAANSPFAWSKAYITVYRTAPGKVGITPSVTTAKVGSPVTYTVNVPKDVLFQAGVTPAQGAQALLCSVDGGAFSACPKIKTTWTQDPTTCGPPFFVCSSTASYSFDDTIGASAGTHTLAVRQRDALGHLGEVSNAVTITVTSTADTTPPPTPSDFGIPLVPFVAGNWSTDANPQIHFQLGILDEPVGKVEWRLDSGPWTDCTDIQTRGTLGVTDFQGECVFKLTGLAEGKHTVSARHTDAAGNVSAVGTSDPWTLDLTPPAVPVLSGAPSGSTTSTSANISFTTDPGTAYVRCKVDGVLVRQPYPTGGDEESSTQFNPLDCPSPLSLSGLAVGQHKVSVSAYDAAGNESAASATWTVAAATVPVQAPSILTPATGVKTVSKGTIGGKSTWVMKLGLLFSTGGDSRGAAQFLTVQVAVDSSGKPVTAKPSDSQPLPTAATATQGVVSWDPSGETGRQSSAAPVWVRVGNKAGKWSGWVKLTQ